MSKPTETKRLILTMTNKGGVGKSTAVIHIADYLLENKIPFIAFDPDHANASFARYFQENGKAQPFMRLINIMDDSSMDQITKAFDEENAKLVIVDGVGAQNETFHAWMEDIGLFDRAEEMGLRITVILIIDEDKDTVDQAKDIAEKVEDRVDYLIIKNLKNTSHTTIYDQSMARKLIIDSLNGKEITFPKLKGHLVTIAQTESLRLSRASNTEKIYINDRARFESYKKTIFKALDSVKSIITP
jgi:cellulose biosynthesis protein BcsQ